MRKQNSQIKEQAFCCLQSFLASRFAEGRCGLGTGPAGTGAGGLVSLRSLVLVEKESLPSLPFEALTVSLVVGVPITGVDV